MGHREAPGGRHDDHGHAIGEAQQGRHVGRGDHERVRAGTRSRPRLVDRFGRRRVDAHHLVAVHLARHHERHVDRIERLEQQRAVALDGFGFVAHVVAQVERGVRGKAHPALAPGESDAHARALVQRLVGERRKTTRAETARGHLWDGQLFGRDHQATVPYRWRFRKSGM